MDRQLVVGQGQYNATVAWLAKAVVAMTVVVLVAGSLVTGFEAALSDPTWPLFVGHWYPMYWVGGLMYEDSHRLTVGVLSLVTLALSIVTLVKDRRPGMRWMAIGAFLLLLAQAIVGGVIIKMLRPVAASMVHASVGQLFFCFVVAYALFTSRGWWGLQPAVEKARAAAGNPELRSRMRGVRRVLTLCAALTYLQIILGSGIRHGNRANDVMFWSFLVAHIVNWTVIVFLVGGVHARLREIREHSGPLRFGAHLAALLVMVQLFLGFFSYFANRSRLDQNTPRHDHVAVSSCHLIVGGFVMATFLVGALRARRLFPPDQDEAPLPASGTASPGKPELSGAQV